jgi:hypothetical protein
MQLWKSVFLRSAGFGVGFAITISCIAGFWFWNNERPKPAKPWNKSAIIAEYDYIDPEGEKDYLVFHYVLQNDTDSDYRIESDTGVQITIKMKKEKGFGAFSSPEFTTTNFPVFVPAKSRVWIALTIPYPYSVKLKEKANSEERKLYQTGVTKFVSEELPNLDGFVLFDNTNRYEIDFPNGWEQRTKQTSLTN